MDLIFKANIDKSNIKDTINRRFLIRRKLDGGRNELLYRYKIEFDSYQHRMIMRTGALSYNQR